MPLGFRKAQNYEEYKLAWLLSSEAYFPPILGGPWDLVTTYNWAYNPTYNPPKWAYRVTPNFR